MRFAISAVFCAGAALLVHPAAATLAAQGSPPAAVPDSAPPRFGWVLDMSVDFGGEAVAELLFANGDRQQLTTGDGFSFSGGLEWYPRTLPRLALRSLVGWKLSTSAAENAEIWFTRVPVELAALYALDRNWRVGAGAVFHLRPTLDLDGVAPNQSFDPATGLLLELAWRPLALTYTRMDYRRADGASFGANAVAFSYSFVWRRQ